MAAAQAATPLLHVVIDNRETLRAAFLRHRCHQAATRRQLCKPRLRYCFAPCRGDDAVKRPIQRIAEPAIVMQQPDR